MRERLERQQGVDRKERKREEGGGGRRENRRRGTDKKDSGAIFRKEIEK